jgi:hypothetical protein
MTTNIEALRNKAVRYAAVHINNDTDWQEIEWNLLNNEQFEALMANFDAEDLYDEILEIMYDADTLAEDWRHTSQQLRDDYDARHPELDTPWWVREA